MVRKIIDAVFGIPIKGEKLPPPSFKTVHPDEKVSQYVWFHMLHVSSRWAKDYFARHAAENYINNIKNIA
jgi:hypothetical protein